MEDQGHPPSEPRALFDRRDDTDSTNTALDETDLSRTPLQDTSHTPHAEDWSLMPDLKKQHDRNVASGFRRRELGVTWKNLSVDVVSADAAINENVLSQFNIPQHIRESRNKAPLRTILHESHGCVKPGEMLLVLGRPGSGCTTLLRMLSNHRLGYKAIRGDVRFGSLTPEEAPNTGAKSL